MTCFRGPFPLVGAMLLGWATVAVVVAALTTWWVLFALGPLAMMASGMAMMGAMARSAGVDPSAGPWAWCGMNAWFAPTNRDVRPRTEHDEQ